MPVFRIFISNAQKCQNICPIKYFPSELQRHETIIGHVAPNIKDFGAMAANLLFGWPAKLGNVYRGAYLDIAKVFLIAFLAQDWNGTEYVVVSISSDNSLTCIFHIMICICYR